MHEHLASTVRITWLHVHVGFLNFPLYSLRSYCVCVSLHRFANWHCVPHSHVCAGMVRWCPSVCYVKDDVLLSTMSRQSQLLRHCKDFRYSIAAWANKYPCSHLYCPSLTLSLSLSFSYPPSFHLPLPKLHIHTGQES